MFMDKHPRISNFFFGRGTHHLMRIKNIPKMFEVSKTFSTYTKHFQYILHA